MTLPGRAVQKLTVASISALQPVEPVRKARALPRNKGKAVTASSRKSLRSREIPEGVLMHFDWPDKTNEDFKNLPETYVIFITEHDVIGGNLPMYTIERQITNMGQPFNDGAHIIYVNGAYKNSSTELGKLMHDFFCTNPDDMNFKQLADKVRYYKKDEKGVAAMCKVMEDMRENMKEETKIITAINLLKLGKLTTEEIAQALDLSVDKVAELAKIQGR